MNHETLMALIDAYEITAVQLTSDRQFSLRSPRTIESQFQRDESRAALSNALREVVQDAARYRWLRINGYVDSYKSHPRRGKEELSMFDAAIDAAMKEPT